MRNPLFRLFSLAVLGIVLYGCGSSPTRLTLEEHPLAGEPEAVPLTFEPVDSNQQYVLHQHAEQRSDTLSQPITAVDGNPTMTSLGDSAELTAVLQTSSENPPRQTVVLERGDQVLFTVDAGMPSPVVPLQSLWLVDDEWTLEILFSDQDAWAGRIYDNGDLVNAAEGYEEAFGFQYLAGYPFFFFERGGKLGYSYGGRETDLGYDQILHYYCCAESTLNPVAAKDMVAFFARNGSQWFYVELGQF